MSKKKSLIIGASDGRGVEKALAFSHDSVGFEAAFTKPAARSYDFSFVKEHIQWAPAKVAPAYKAVVAPAVTTDLLNDQFTFKTKLAIDAFDDHRPVASFDMHAFKIEKAAAFVDTADVGWHKDAVASVAPWDYDSHATAHKAAFFHDDFSFIA